jgi:hypothetical protein
MRESIAWVRGGRDLDDVPSGTIVRTEPEDAYLIVYERAASMTVLFDQ